jgi:hypothetical protein
MCDSVKFPRHEDERSGRNKHVRDDPILCDWLAQLAGAAERCGNAPNNSWLTTAYCLLVVFTVHSVTLCTIPHTLLVLDPHTMADYDIFREQLGIRFPAHGHALWDPSPPEPDRPVEVGDVGFVRRGKFHCLFNALRPKGEQADVPEGYEQLVPKSSKHITKSSLNSGHYCSVGVDVDPDGDTYRAV